jgi:transketolase
MRTAFISTLEALAAQDERIWLVCGDVGFSVLENFAVTFPDRFVNVGVAEQNMTGLAAGLAMSGKIVFTYSIANFPVFRCLEQVRNDVCYHNLNVKIVAVGAGLSYGAQGYTHHGLEDLAVMRVMPNMTIFSPGDPVEAAWATEACLIQQGPCYLRLGKGGEPIIHTTKLHLEIGKGIVVQDGSDLTIATSAGTLQLALEAAASLVSAGVAAEVLSFPTLQPFDFGLLGRSLAKTGRLITMEEHGKGGLGSIVAEFLATSDQRMKFRPLCVNGTPGNTAGGRDVLCTRAGLSVENAVQLTKALLCAP